MHYLHFRLFSLKKVLSLHRRNSCSKCHNALLMVRLCCEYFVENFPEDVCLSYFNDGK